MNTQKQDYVKEKTQKKTTIMDLFIKRKND